DRTSLEVGSIWRMVLFFGAWVLVLGLCYSWETVQSPWVRMRSNAGRNPLIRGGWVVAYAPLIVLVSMSSEWPATTIVVLRAVLAVCSLWVLFLLRGLTLQEMVGVFVVGVPPWGVLTLLFPRLDGVLSYLTGLMLAFAVLRGEDAVLSFAWSGNHEDRVD